MATGYIVYRLDRSDRDVSASPAPLPELFAWTPSLTRVIPRDLLGDRGGFAKNWVFHLPTMMFASPPYEVFFLRERSEVVAQCLVTGPSKRFPFMQKNDLQIGLVQTAPAQRSKGFARRMVAAVIDAHPQCHSYWWLTTDDNIASQKVADGAGFKAAGTARRVSRLGIPRFYLNELRPQTP